MLLRNIDALCDPVAAVDLRCAASVLTTAEPVVITDGGTEVLSGGRTKDWARVAAALRDLPAPTVLVGDPARCAPSLADAVDLCLTDVREPPRPWVHGSVEQVTDAVADQPAAALALVLLLRSTARLDVTEQVWAESATYAALLGSAGHRTWLAGRDAPSPQAVGDEQRMISTRSGGVLTVELNRPESRNAVDTALRDQLVEALALAECDPTIETVRLSGRGQCFSAGGDLNEFGLTTDPGTSLVVRATRHPGLAVARIARRVEARLHGTCVGAGIEIPAFAHRVVATSDATFWLPELRMGLIPGAGGTASIGRRVGRHRCCWLVLTSAAIEAATARSWGLIDGIVAG